MILFAPPDKDPDDYDELLTERERKHLRMAVWLIHAGATALSIVVVLIVYSLVFG